MNPVEIDLFRQRWIQQSPITYRYMSNQYIERFFKYGELRLTSYQRFRNDNTDEIRGDEQEGINEYLIWSKERTHKLTLRRSTGDNNHILCTSLIYDTDLFNEDNFNCDGCFKISNTLGFGFEIARKLNNYTYGLEGPVKYSPTGQIDIYIEDYGLEDFSKNALQNPEEKEKLIKVFNEISMRDTSVFFSKRQKYMNQSEYRFIWSHQQHIVNDHIIIQVPEAVKFCEWLTK